MIKSELSLDISESLNSKIMRIFDTSHYCSDETIENYIIEVLPVNKSLWVSFNVAKYFSLTLNSSNLRYKKASDAVQLIDIPDGIYEIKQSVKPNLFTIAHFYHFRTVSLERKIQKEKQKLIKNECKLSRQEYISNRDTLREIDEYVKAAKWDVEECGDKKAGKELYEFANNLLDRYTHECKC